MGAPYISVEADLEYQISRLETIYKIRQARIDKFKNSWYRRNFDKDYIKAMENENRRTAVGISRSQDALDSLKKLRKW